jgi:heme/copper-type cytochrome/quinol oxidase subunit 2
MNGLSIFLFLWIVLLIGAFIIGVVILFVGHLKKDKKNSTIKTGLIITAIPLAVLAILFLYDFARDKSTKKPSDKDLIGIYHISEASGQIPKALYSSYRLEFKNDGTFYLSPTPKISVCENGKFTVDWQFDYNELSFQCDKAFTLAHIDRGFSGFKIEFIIGDPDSGESIFFSKDK